MVRLLHVFPRVETGMSNDPKIVSTSELLARMLDPNHPEQALQAELDSGGVEGVVEEARLWLRDGEQAPPDLEDSVRLVAAQLHVLGVNRD